MRLRGTKIDSLSKTLYYMSKMARKNGFKNVEEFVASRVVNDSDNTLLNKLMDKMYPNLSKIDQTNKMDEGQLNSIKSALEFIQGVKTQRIEELNQAKINYIEKNLMGDGVAPVDAEVITVTTEPQEEEKTVELEQLSLPIEPVPPAETNEQN